MIILKGTEVIKSNKRLYAMTFYDEHCHSDSVVIMNKFVTWSEFYLGHNYLRQPICLVSHLPIVVNLLLAVNGSIRVEVAHCFLLLIGGH